MNECARELACARARAFVFMLAANVNSRLRIFTKSAMSEDVGEEGT